VTPNPPVTRPSRSGILLSALGAVGLVSAFVDTVTAFTVLEAAGSKAVLTGADNELGYPSSALALVFFAAVLATGVSRLAGARFVSGWWTALVAVLSVGVVFELWATVLGFSPLRLLQLLLIAAAVAIAARKASTGERPLALGIFLTVAASIGFFAAFRLTVDKVGLFVNPNVAPSCNLSVLVQCGVNLKSWQGSLFSFPNTLIGLVGWVAPFFVGVAILSGVRFARWFWIAFNVGIAGALTFVIWLIGQSIFVLGTLCPWCMVTWSVVIPTFWAVTLYNLTSGNIPVSPRARRVFDAAYGFVPLITLLSYIVVAIMAQARLDVLNHL
jgi:uncharacterized membrane protein